MLDVIADLEADPVGRPVVRARRLALSQRPVLAHAPRAERVRAEGEEKGEHHVRERTQPEAEPDRYAGQGAKDVVGEKPAIARRSISRPRVEDEVPEGEEEEPPPRRLSAETYLPLGGGLRIAALGLPPIAEEAVVQEVLVAKRRR